MDFTGERYVPEIEGQIRYEHLHRYALCMQLVAGKTVLDIASGEGYGAALLASAASSVTGVDVDAATVEHARHLYYKPNLTFLVGGCDKIPLPDNSFDVVTSFETIEHHDKHDEMLDEIKRVLKPGGALVISSPNRLTYSDEPGYKNPFHVKELYYDEFFDLLRPRFKSIRMFGQRLAAGSFVFPLGASGGAELKSLTGDAGEIRQDIRELPSPIYFVAICSDDAAIQTRDISSVYFDRSDDLFKVLEKQRVDDVRTMQEQVRRLEADIDTHSKGYQDQIAQMSAGYEAEIRRQSEAIVAFNEELNQRAAEIEDINKEIVRREDALAQLRAHWLVSEKNIRDHQKNIQEYQNTLIETRDQLSRCLEIINWIYASRSWRISSSLRKIDELKERRSAGASAIFEGQLEPLPPVVSDFLDIRGWVRSKAAPISFVEAFLDDFYLGRVRYGHERPDRFSDRISLHGLNFVGTRTLRVRVYDQQGNKHVYSSAVGIAPESQKAAPKEGPPEIFQATLEYPAPDAVLAGSFEITGWAFSRGGAITFVQASLDGISLGRVNYGLDRNDVVKAFPASAPLRCGFSSVFSLDDLTSNGQRKLKVQLYDDSGNTFVLECPVSIVASPFAIVTEQPNSTGVEAAASGNVPPQLEQVISDFQIRMQRDPSVLDWHSNLNLAGLLPRLAVFSPPPNQDANVLPYFDHTVDIVVLADPAPESMAEARRVAAAASVLSTGKDQMQVEWQMEVKENQLQTTSIIIPVYNNIAYTRKCLDRLRATLPPDFRGEIIVVDDASSDETPEVLKQFAAADRRIKVFRNEKNSGFIANCNRGAKEASGEILVFLNNDTEPAEGWLPALLRVFRERRDVGAVGGKLIYPDGTLQEAGGVIFSDGSGCNFGKFDKAANAPLYSFLREVDYCSGALLATPRALFLQLGGFDTRYEPAYYEDTDYCFSLRARGYRVYYQPESVIVHFEGISSGTDITKGVKSYQAANRIKFVEKWKDVLRQQPAPPRRLDPPTMQQLAFFRTAASE